MKQKGWKPWKRRCLSKTLSSVECFEPHGLFTAGVDIALCGLKQQDQILVNRRYLPHPLTLHFSPAPTWTPKILKILKELSALPINRTHWSAHGSNQTVQCGFSLLTTTSLSRNASKLPLLSFKPEKVCSSPTSLESLFSNCTCVKVNSVSLNKDEVVLKGKVNLSYKLCTL